MPWSTKEKTKFTTELRQIKRINEVRYAGNLERTGLVFQQKEMPSQIVNLPKRPRLEGNTQHEQSAAFEPRPSPLLAYTPKKCVDSKASDKPSLTQVNV